MNRTAANHNACGRSEKPIEQAKPMKRKVDSRKADLGGYSSGVFDMPSKRWLRNFNRPHDTFCGSFLHAIPFFSCYHPLQHLPKGGDEVPIQEKTRSTLHTALDEQARLDRFDHPAQPVQPASGSSRLSP